VIVTWLTGALTSVLSFVVGLFPTWTYPSWLSGSSTTAGTLGGYAHAIGGAMGDFSAWIPLSVVGPCLAAVLAALGVSLAVRVIRMIASFLTGGGGGS
jgi:hypothetical protein